RGAAGRARLGVFSRLPGQGSPWLAAPARQCGGRTLESLGQKKGAKAGAGELEVAEAALVIEAAGTGVVFTDFERELGAAAGARSLFDGDQQRTTDAAPLKVGQDRQVVHVDQRTG